jgi:predicted amidophosphoribosyltransferase
MTTTETKTEQTPSEQTQLPTCRNCQRQAGLSGGICAFCMAKATGPSYLDARCPVWRCPPTEEEAAELDRAFTALREQAVREGWVGKGSDSRRISPGKHYK